ncbi:site-specific integrase [Terasakiella sp. SH-1]|uniref:tyrosine-type recombinase/integrase n=1 Tax=Terasakiella sp. SH-1 TaxID=2560057 RepID=UPI001073782D|nr:site-specific integrase [Terasakiella sp. SH-1]
MPKLTKRLIDSLKPADKEYSEWDDELKGFGVRVSPKGAKTFQVYWRVAGRRERKRKVGRYPAMTVDQARKAAFELLSEVERGNDPAVKQDLLRKAETMKELCERFMTEHSIPHNKENTIADNHSMIDRFILPKLGATLAVDVAKMDVRRLHQSCSKTPYQANRLLSLLSKIFNFASDDLLEIRHDWRNPAERVQKFKEEKRRRYLSRDELQAVSQTLNIAETEGLAVAQTVAAIRLLIFTGARHREILTAKWEYVNWERACLSLPDSKTGAKDIPLNGPALAILQGIDKLKDNPYMIVGKFKGTHWEDLSPTWRRIRQRATVMLLEQDDVWGPVIKRHQEETGKTPTLNDLEKIATDKDYKLPGGVTDVRIHDLRHSFASIGVGAGITLHQIGGLMGHTQTQTTARYAHLATDPQQQAAEVIGRQLSDAMGLEQESAEIIQFSKK